MSDLQALAREVIEHNRYLVLGTIDDSGRPRLSPVYFTHVEHREFFWVSSPDSHHSHNVDERPDVSLVVFDSSVAVGQGRAVYVDAVAQEVPAADLPAACARAFAVVGPDAVAFGPEEVSGDSDIRLYVARATRHEVHVRGGDPAYERSVDWRQSVDL
jgi:nitroimidazol reductase NimA-like FMN-containing flavoprotein (pyridoxamine 5'-phosphate oxidase superfamily)